MAALDRRQVALIVVGYAAGLAAVPFLDAPMPLAIALALPALATTNCFIFHRLGRTRPEHDNQSSSAAIREIGLRVTLFEIALHALILMNLSGVLPSGSQVPARLVLILFGVLLIGVGDLLPRTRPNLAVGIRTVRTLGNRRVWVQLHRVAGYATVAFGVLIVIAGAFLGNPALPQVISLAAMMVLFVVAAWYRRVTRLGDAR